jgi:hypothetical protein
MCMTGVFAFMRGFLLHGYGFSPLHVRIGPRIEPPWRSPIDADVLANGAMRWAERARLSAGREAGEARAPGP